MTKEAVGSVGTELVADGAVEGRMGGVVERDGAGEEGVDGDNDRPGEVGKGGEVAKDGAFGERVGCIGW